MAFSPGALLNVLRRDKAQDPFGGEDLFDGESALAGKGPKIALIASGVLFLALAGGIATIILTGDKTAATPAVGGMLTDLKVEEDVPAEAPHAVAANTPTAPAAPAPAVAADTTAATDRSVQRRPWLTAAEPTDAKRPGMTDTTKKPAAPALAPPPPLPTPEAKVAAAPPPPAAHAPEAKTAAAPPAPAPVDPHAKEPPKAAPAETKMAALPPTAPAKTADVKAADMKPAEDEASQPPKDIGGIPSLNASGAAPGAPKLFDLPKNADTGPNAAGGRPRLAEPALPPTDKVALNAPPPRFANLNDIKKDSKTAAAAATPVTGAKLAVVVDGLGLSQVATDAAITKLPAAVTLAFSPYARDLKKWIEKAKASGHEVLIEVPMESKSFPAEDPGPLGLLTSNDAKENGIRIDAILKDAGSAVGVLDSSGSKFREDQNINSLFAKLKEKNLFYVQGEPGVRMGEPGVPTAVADVVIDERPFRAAVDARLDYAERLAKYQGSAVASISAKPVNFERLVLWMEQSQKKGVTLAPMSQVLIR